MEWPAVMPLWLEDVLGSPPWRVAKFHRALRACGVEMKPHYEEETAAGLFFMITMALAHGPDWFEASVDLIDERLVFMSHVRAMARIVLEALDG